jgi:inner membrane protein
MTGRTHDLAAITFLGVAVIILPVPALSLGTIIGAILANQIGGIAPDIDQPVAPLWRNLPVGGFFGKIITKMMGGHRFLTHSLIGAGLLCFLAYYFLHFISPVLSSTISVDIIWWSFTIGVASHLIMDTFTKEGVPWFLPLPVKIGIPPLKRLRITTGKWGETLGVFPLLIAVDIFLCASHYQEILVFLHGHVVR